jgi:integrase
MPRKRLTEEGVRKLKGIKGQQVYYFDTGLKGVVLCLGATKKTWYAMHYVGGISRYHRLGHYPVLSVLQARERAKKFLADPQKALAEDEVGTFKEVTENFIKRHVAATRDRVELRSRKEIERCLNTYVLPRWRDLKFTDVKHKQVNELLDKIEDRNGASQADAVLAVIRKIFRWYQSRVGAGYVVPVVQGMNRDKRTAAERARNRNLAEDEIRAVWNACDGIGTFGAIVKLCLLTAQRREKIATMRWDDLDEITIPERHPDGSMGVRRATGWKIRKEPREKNTPEILPLSPMALDIIAAQPRIVGNPYVFVGSNRGRRLRAGTLTPTEPPHFNSWGQRKTELDEKLPAMPHWTIHDLRRTARSLMSDADIRPDIAERVLGHAITGVWGIYDRSKYLVQMNHALQALAAKIASIIETPPEGRNVARPSDDGCNVIPIPQRVAF